ncbi:MAG: DUF362 domain-containing protein [bacterium]
MIDKNLTRREFLKTGTMAVAASTLLMNAPMDLFGQADSKTRVVLIRNKNVLDKNGTIKVEILQQMLDEAVQTLFETNDVQSAWKKIIKPEDIVGIKTNVWQYFRTPFELEESIKKRVIEVGVAADNISINDRGVLSDPIFQKATALINSRPMRTHYWSGVGTLLKNYIMFTESPAYYHPDSCADLAAIWKLPIVSGKTRLNVLVMLTPLFNCVGAHGYSSDYVWNYKGIIVGVDPVACDSIGLKIIQAKRKNYFKEERPLSPPAKHIELADTRYHLGTADVNKIDLIKLDWKDEILI